MIVSQNLTVNSKDVIYRGEIQMICNGLVELFPTF